MDECALRRHVNNLGLPCDEDRCLFWAHLGPEGDGDESRCAIQYFELLGDSGKEMAEWLLSLKDHANLHAVLGIDGPASGVTESD